MFDRLTEVWAAAFGYVATAARFLWHDIVVPLAEGIVTIPLPVALLAAVTGAALGVLAAVVYAAYERRRG